MENRWQYLKVLWSGEDRLLSKRASVPFTRFFVEYMGRARSLGKLPSEWDSPIE